MRTFLGIAVGLVAAFLSVFAVESVGHMLFPPPAGLDMRNPADQARMIEMMPVAAKAIVVIAWFVGALIGAAIANFIARRSIAGWIVAVLVIAAGVATMLMFPHPIWMWLAGLLLPLIAAWVAQRAVRVPGAVV